MSSPTHKDQCKFSSKLLEQKVLIIGGTSGIGFGVAEGALEAGAQVHVSSSNPDKVAKAVERLKTAYPSKTSKISGSVCDLGSTEHTETRLRAPLDSVGKPINHIVFTAGDSVRLGKTADLDVERVKAASSVRFFGPMLTGKLAPLYLANDATSSLTLTGGANSAKPAKDWM